MTTKLSVFESARRIFNNTAVVVDTGGSDREYQPGELSVGTMMDPMIRNFYCEGERLRLLMLDEEESFTQTYRRERPCFEALVSHQERQTEIDAIRVMMNDLFWQGVLHTFPGNWNDIALRDGWLVVSPSGRASSTPLFETPDHLALTFFGDLRRAMSGPEVSAAQVEGERFPLVSLEREETIIGEIVSPVVLGVGVVLERLSRVPELKPVHQVRASSEAEARCLIEAAVTRNRYVTEQVSMARQIFWRGVRDTVPKADGHNNLGLRKGWKVVHIPAEDSEIAMEEAAKQMLERLRQILDRQG